MGNKKTEHKKNNWKILNRSMLLLLVLSIVSASICFAEEADTIENAFRQGKISGEIGNYFEYVDRDAEDSDSGWSTAYLTLKYETLSWNRLAFGARFFAHGQLYSDHENGTTDPYEVDIETNFTLPEMYLSYGFLDQSNATVGRWNHQKVSHIDDAQSEGGYVSFKEIENVELIVGAMTSFAEIDYDDSEDFGRTNDAQDVDHEATYGAGSGPMVVFVEGKFEPLKEIKVNPYFMYHDDYAHVIGIDTQLDLFWEDYEVKYGAKAIYYHVNADINTSDDANVWAIQPFIAKGPVKLDFSYSQFDDGSALNKPAWLTDYLNVLVDQDVIDAKPDADVFEARIKYAFEKLWLSYTFASADCARSATEGEGYTDNEFQIGYNITDNLDINLRYFIVVFEDIDNRDYNKVETRLRFKF